MIVVLYNNDLLVVIDNTLVTYLFWWTSHRDQLGLFLKKIRSVHSLTHSLTPRGFTTDPFKVERRRCYSGWLRLRLRLPVDRQTDRQTDRQQDSSFLSVYLSLDRSLVLIKLNVARLQWLHEYLIGFVSVRRELFLKVRIRGVGRLVQYL